MTCLARNELQSNKASDFPSKDSYGIEILSHFMKYLNFLLMNRENKEFIQGCLGAIIGIILAGAALNYIVKIMFLLNE